jgi:putative hydrolase of the HAD superfamily
MSHSLAAVIFDFGHVLSEKETQGRTAEIARACGLSVPDFEASYALYRPEYDRGKMNGTDYWRLLSKQTGKKLGEEETCSLIELDTRNSTELNPLMLGWAQQLAQEKFRIAILSNMTTDDMSRMQREGVLDRLGAFEVKVFSSWVGLVKPEEQIYTYCLKLLELEPHEALFIDDKEVNTAAAVELGMRAYLFRAAEADLPVLCRQYDLPFPERIS